MADRTRQAMLGLQGLEKDTEGGGDSSCTDLRLCSVDPRLETEPHKSKLGAM